jgi:hypothetical protein
MPVGTPHEHAVCQIQVQKSTLYHLTVCQKCVNARAGLQAAASQGGCIRETPISDGPPVCHHQTLKRDRATSLGQSPKVLKVFVGAQTAQTAQAAHSS